MRPLDMRSQWPRKNPHDAGTGAGSEAPGDEAAGSDDAGGSDADSLGGAP